MKWNLPSIFFFVNSSSLSIRVWVFDIYIKWALRFVSWDIRRSHRYFCLPNLKFAPRLLSVGNYYILMAIVNSWSTEINYTIFGCYICGTLHDWCLWILHCHIKWALAFVSWAIDCINLYLGLAYWEFTSRSMTVDNFKTCCSIISHSRSEVNYTLLRRDVFWTLYFRSYGVDIYVKSAFINISCVICPCHCYNCLTKWEFTSGGMRIGDLNIFCYIIGRLCLKVHYWIFLCYVLRAMNFWRMLI